MQIYFWGVRGSIPSPITGKDIEEKIYKILQLARPSDILSEESIKKFIDSLPFSLRSTYGANTTCVEIRSQKGEILIIDAGSGIRPLGIKLMKEGFYKGGKELSIILTHTHWDHIQGLLFFPPIYIPGNRIQIYSAFPDIEERLRYQQNFSFFPVSYENMAAEKEVHIVQEEEDFSIYSFQIRCKKVNHPGGNYAYRIQEGDKTFIFCSDAEFNLEVMDSIEEYIKFFYQADVLVFDTQYTFEEFLQKIDWGHSSAQVAVDIAVRSRVKKLILFHHDPTYDDEKMDSVYMQALKYKDMTHPSYPLEIEPGYEGLHISLE